MWNVDNAGKSCPLPSQTVEEKEFSDHHIRSCGGPNLHHRRLLPTNRSKPSLTRSQIQHFDSKGQVEPCLLQQRRLPRRPFVVSCRISAQYPWVWMLRQDLTSRPFITASRSATNSTSFPSSVAFGLSKTHTKPVSNHGGISSQTVF